MGNTPMTVGLRTDQDYYTAGSTVTGRVYVSVASKLAQPVQSLLLRIVGEEEVVVHHTTTNSQHTNNNNSNSNNSEHQQDHYERATVCFLRLEYPLHTFENGTLPPGQYEYPFAIQLPHSSASLPSSMMCRKGQSHCHVQYELVATVQTPNSGIFRSHPTAHQRLQLFSVVPPPTSTSKTQQHHHPQQQHLPLEHIPVKNCCCCCWCGLFGKGGTMGLEVKVDRTMVQPHDTVTIAFRCQNESSVAVTGIRVQLEQIIEWECHGHHERVHRVLDQRDLDSLHSPDVWRSLQPQQQGRRRGHGQYAYDFGTVPTSTATAATTQESALVNSNVPTTNHHDHDHDEDWHTSQLQIPAQSQDSMNGRMIDIRHVLSVQLRTKGCCTTNPEASTRMQVYRSVPSQTDAMADDPCWTTTVAPSAPPDTYDATTTTAAALDTAYKEEDGGGGAYDDLSPPMAQAQALPADWNAQTAQVVTIPMAEAVVLVWSNRHIDDYYYE